MMAVVKFPEASLVSLAAFGVSMDGQRIEVIGFVHHDRELYAVWRNDEGVLYELPASRIRMDPSTVKVEA